MATCLECKEKDLDDCRRCRVASLAKFEREKNGNKRRVVTATGIAVTSEGTTRTEPSASIADCFVGSRSGLLESRHVVSFLGAQSWHCSRMNSPADQRATLVRLDGRELPMINMRLLWRGVGHRDGIQS